MDTLALLPWVTANLALTIALSIVLPETRNRPCEETFQRLVPLTPPSIEEEALLGQPLELTYGSLNEASL